jgi:predicted RNase H-like nuclease (RuvC/YqgF family)
MAETEIVLDFNECGMLIYMFPQQWQGSQKQLEILEDFMPDMEDRVNVIKKDLQQLREDYKAKKVSEEDFEARSKEIAEIECYVLKSSRAVNMIKDQWNSTKFPRMFSKTVFSLRDKLGLY